MQKCYLAMGCFWKPEEQFKSQKGILDTEVGYAGGYKSKVTYEEVCQGNTGHAEIVKLSFDKTSTLAKVEQFAGADAKSFEMEKKIVVSTGRKLSFWQQMFGNISNFSSEQFLD